MLICSSTPGDLSLNECVEHLRKESGMVFPETNNDWSKQKHTNVMVRRECFLKDAMKETKKKRFDPTKLIYARSSSPYSMMHNAMDQATIMVWVKICSIYSLDSYHVSDFRPTLGRWA